MDDPLKVARTVGASGLHAQSHRMRVISENLANAQSTAAVAGGEPYARKTISFTELLSDADGVSRVGVAGIDRDNTGFQSVYDPGHPAADQRGYVLRSNVNMISEIADMREATRSYEANLRVIQQVRDMSAATIDLLRNGR